MSGSIYLEKEQAKFMRTFDAHENALVLYATERGAFRLEKMTLTEAMNEKALHSDGMSGILSVDVFLHLPEQNNGNKN